jgi:hypothetical protein
VEQEHHKIKNNNRRYYIMKFRKVLLGGTKEGTLVFADIHVGGEHRNYFSVSFSEVRPVVVTDEFLRERAEGYIDGMDKESLYDLCERFDCKPSDLVEELVREANYIGIESLVDISLYPESYSIDGYNDDVYFESWGCGQHDTREYLIPIDPEFSEWLHSLWDTCHLQQLTEEEYGIYISRVIEEYLGTFDESEWIEKWLIENEELWS